MDFLNELNKIQYEAVTYTDGASLVIAGAGSGKTRVLTYKIAYLLEKGVSPVSIMALTFTNKAAREMKNRIGKLVGFENTRYLWMGTFHSIFSRILRAEAEHIGYTKDFTIYDSADSKSLIKSIIKELQLDEKVYKPNSIQGRISTAKNNLITVEAYYKNKDLQLSDANARVPRTKEIYALYASRCKQANAMDFDDLLLQTNLLFQKHPDILEKYQSFFQYILVDEYQDTNFSQYLIVKKLAEKHNRICVVGDDAQSIYSFRGANIDNILNFQKNFKNTKIFKLEQNYRSTQTIVNAANCVIEKNSEQIRKKVFSNKDKGTPIRLNSVTSDIEEATYVANKVKELMREEPYNYSDFAVLYRTNSQSRVMEESFRKKKIPYRIYGGLSFYQRKEIKNVIAYFRLVANLNDDEALKRIINYPVRGIGNVTLNKLIETANVHNVPIWAVLDDLLKYNVNVNAGTTRKLANFRDLIQGFSDKVMEQEAYDLGTEIVKTTGMLSDALTKKSAEDLSRIDNIQELLKAIHEYTENKKQEDGVTKVLLIDFLSEVSLATDQDNNVEDENEKVTLMTIHAAKGLEFKTVFIVGLEEELFPSPFAQTTRDLEEERRLFYVAVTRAEQHCFLSYSKSRFKNGMVKFCNPSRFLADIDKEYIEEVEPQFSNNFSNNNQWENKGNSSFSIERNKFRDRMPSYSSTPRKALKKINVNQKERVDNSDFPVGCFVKHKVFGLGKVLETYTSNSNEMIVIDFSEKGKKSLLMKFAKLEKMK